MKYISSLLFWSLIFVFVYISWILSKKSFHLEKGRPKNRSARFSVTGIFKVEGKISLHQKRRGVRLPKQGGGMLQSAYPFSKALDLSETTSSVSCCPVSSLWINQPSKQSCKLNLYTTQSICTSWASRSTVRCIL